ncbi:MAG: iron complex outermembrane receptor protein [Halioglobus sp.]|jgi:iron complex outermembrane receptor protein
MKLRLTPFFALTAGTLATMGMGASAQDNSTSNMRLEEVVVTAEKRSQSVQDIPISVTAFSQADMELRNATDLRALQNFTPNLKFNNESGGQNNSRVTLRGIGSETLVGGGDPGVALHVDGIYVGRNSATAQSAFDLERLEVLRGPQGTLYGRNATGGSINVITRKAIDEFEAEADVTLGNYDLVKVRGILNVPLTDNVYSRFSILSEDRDGFLENSYSGGGDNDDKDLLSIRGQVLWDLDDGNEIILRAFYSESEGVGAGSKYLGSDTGYQFSDYLVGISNGEGPPPGVPIGGPVYTQPNSGTPAQPMSRDLHEISKNADEFIDMEHQGVNLTVEWNLTSNVMLRSISSYETLDNESLVDADNSELSIEERARDNQAKQWSQEFNLLSSGDDALQWILGAFIYHEEVEEDFSIFTPGGLLDFSIPLPGGQQPGGNGLAQYPSADYEADSYAVFGQGTYSLTEALRVTVGLRYSVDEKEQSRTGVGITDNVTGYRLLSGGATGPEAAESVDDDWSDVTGKLGIDYDLGENSMIFASFSTGYKSGGIPFNGVMEPYEPEEVTAYEIGIKSELFDNRVRLNLATFYYDYTDLQVFRLTADGPKVENAAESTIWGVEAEFMALLTENFRIDGSLGLLDAEYEDYVVEFPPPEAADYSGNTLNHAPEYNFNLGGQYDTSLGNGDLTIRLDYINRGDTYFDRANTDDDLQKAYDLFNVNIRYNQGNWYIALFGENLSDEEYVTGQLINPPFSCNCRTVGVGAPRTYGVTFGMSWD